MDGWMDGWMDQKGAEIEEDCGKGRISKQSRETCLVAYTMK
jgi:hypothetical protein